MAVDTSTKRASVIGVGLPASHAKPFPTGTVARTARHILAYLYSGISLQILAGTYSNSGQGTTRVLSITEVQAIV